MSDRKEIKMKVQSVKKMSAWEQVKMLSSAGKLSWAASIAEQDILGKKYASLSDDEKQAVHQALYEGALEKDTEEEFLEGINDILSEEKELSEA